MRTVMAMFCVLMFMACEGGAASESSDATGSETFQIECSAHPDCYAKGHTFCVKGVCTGDPQPDVLPTNDVTKDSNSETPDAVETAETGSMDNSVDSSTDSNTDMETIVAVCTVDSQCADDKVCTMDTCNPASVFAGANGCVHAWKTACCVGTIDCADGFVCTENVCVKEPECLSVIDCGIGGGCGCEGDVYSCSGSACLNGKCGMTVTSTTNCEFGCDGSGCKAQCTSDSECANKSACTHDQCVNGKCVFTLTAMTTCTIGGLPGVCQVGTCWNNTPQGNCFDNDPCTDDATSNGVCVHAKVCADGNPCTTDTCEPIPSGLSDHTCHFVPINGCGVTVPECTTDAQCQGEDKCFDYTCDLTTNKCLSTNRCIGIDAKKRLCGSNFDCGGNEFGDYCVESGDKSLGQSVKLCQPCFFVTDSFVGCNAGEVCRWGVFSTGQLPIANTSDYWCEKRDCTTDSDCAQSDDPCAIGTCSSGKCVVQQKLFCMPCSTNSDCAADTWCDNEGGGVMMRFAQCVDQNCRLKGYSSGPVVEQNNCNSTLTCETDSDCPLTGECILHSCYYSGNMQTYPECQVDAQCAAGYVCTKGTCLVDPNSFTIEVKCPTERPVAVIWYASTSVSKQPGETFTATRDQLCTWGWDNMPTLKYNCRTADGMTWGLGNLAQVMCNNPVDFTTVPDVQYGPQGQMVLQFKVSCQ